VPSVSSTTLNSRSVRWLIDGVRHLALPPANAKTDGHDLEGTLLVTSNAYNISTYTRTAIGDLRDYVSPPVLDRVRSGGEAKMRKSGFVRERIVQILNEQAAGCGLGGMPGVWASPQGSG
jgi:hypothetical protein